MAVSPDATGASGTLTAGSAHSAEAKAEVLASLWEHFAGTARHILDRASEPAERGLSEMIATFDLLFRSRCGERKPDGRIRDVILFQLHGTLTERLHAFMMSTESRTEKSVVDWLIGSITICFELANLSIAFEHVTQENTDTGALQFSFAGNSSFIPIEQVVQLLGRSRYRGVLTLEDDDIRLDLYFDNTTIAYMSPHTLLRRVLTGRHMREFREIPADMITRAQRHLAESDMPIAVSLAEERFIKEHEIRDTSFLLGTEVFYSLLRNKHEVRFRYCPLERLPAYVIKYRVDTPVTPLLLEANKLQDDWQRLLRIFPNPDQPVESTDEALINIGSMDLAAHELRLLTAIDNGKATPRTLVDITGLPLSEVYRTLIRFARDEVVKPQCDADVFAELILQGIAEEDGSEQKKANPRTRPTERIVDRSVSDALDFLDG